MSLKIHLPNVKVFSKGMSLLKIDDVIVDTIAKENSKHNVNINSGSSPNDTPDFEIEIFGTPIFYKTNLPNKSKFKPQISKKGV